MAERRSVQRLEADSKELFEIYDPEGMIDRYIELVFQENEKMNLVSRETQRSDLERLAAESILPLEVLEDGPFGNMLDIGSGSGLPAIPLLITGSVLEGTLVERTQKKAAALERMIDSLGLPASVVPKNLDEAGINGPFDLITLRLVRLTGRLLSAISRLSHENTVLIYYARPETSLKLSGWTAEGCSFRVDKANQDKRFTLLRKKA